MCKFSFSMPYPPSVNQIWRRSKFSTYLSKVGRDYYVRAVLQISAAFKAPTLMGRLCVAVKIYPPDRRKRDVDNILKATFDACTRAKVWGDDSQIEKLLIERCAVEKGGRIEILIEEIKGK